MAEYFTKPISDIFYMIGLDTQLRRFIGVTAAGTLIEAVVKPEYAFSPDGKMKDWCVFVNGAGCTYTPIGFFPAIAGIVAALYV